MTKKWLSTVDWRERGLPTFIWATLLFICGIAELVAIPVFFTRDPLLPLGGGFLILFLLTPERHARDKRRYLYFATVLYLAAVLVLLWVPNTPR
jgi:hypothetical protein